MGALLLTVAACRADSVTMPSSPMDPVCYDAACTTPGELPPNASIVILPLEDATDRIVPHMVDARARTELTQVLTALRQELLAGRVPEARIQLAYAYDRVELASRRLTTSGEDAVALDLADLSAIRLALVPASNALGVSVR